jgi:hypothetical protein
MFGFAVGLGSVGAGAEVADPEGAAGGGWIVERKLP